jgi:DUF1009 family protein
MATMMKMTAERIESGQPSAGDRRVALIAGSGRLPEEVAAKLAEHGKAPFVVVLAGEGPDDRFDAYEHTVLKLE